MNPISLSRFFKEQSGVTLLEYLNQLRIQKSKELILQGLSNTMVAESVGYCNDHTFLRIFKKIEGVTPGMFRESNLPR